MKGKKILSILILLSVAQLSLTAFTFARCFSECREKAKEQSGVVSNNHHSTACHLEKKEQPKGNVLSLKVGCLPLEKMNCLYLSYMNQAEKALYLEGSFYFQYIEAIPINLTYFNSNPQLNFSQEIEFNQLITSHVPIYILKNHILCWSHFSFSILIFSN